MNGVDGGRVRAIAFGPRLGGRGQFGQQRVYLVLRDLSRRCELVNIVYEALGRHDDHKRDRLLPAFPK